MAKWTKLFKIVEPTIPTSDVSGSQGVGAGSYGNYNTWYHRLVQGSANRLTRYRSYDIMDSDVEITRALDTIAEEMTGNSNKNNMPLEVSIESSTQEDIPEEMTMTLEVALRYWSNIHDWGNRLFNVARTLSKYGDCFFYKKDEFKRWEYIHPKQVIGAVVDADNITNIVAWKIKTDANKENSSFGLNMATQLNVETIPADDIVRFSLNSDMDEGAPFGESILRSVFKAHKQKELLEDAIIIYRVQRAPERRVFYIDVGSMHPGRIPGYLDQIKNDIKQKKVPTSNGGTNQVDSVYNPMSMSEDFFFATKDNGRGSRVETLPGGQGLGELADLEYFQAKVFRGLRVPTSYMASGSDGGMFNDGKVGIAYIEELRFSQYIKRLQGPLERIMEYEFKKYLKRSNIQVDDTLFKLRLPEPSNFGVYRQQEVDSNLLSSYSTADGIEYLSKRFIAKKYLQLTDAEILENERLYREENGLDHSPDAIGKMYSNSMDDDGLSDISNDIGMDSQQTDTAIDNN